MSGCIYAKEVEQLSFLYEDTQETRELLRTIVTKIRAGQLHSNKGKLAEVVKFLPDALKIKTGT